MTPVALRALRSCAPRSWAPRGLARSSRFSADAALHLTDWACRPESLLHSREAPPVTVSTRPRIAPPRTVELPAGRAHPTEQRHRAAQLPPPGSAHRRRAPGAGGAAERGAREREGVATITTRCLDEGTRSHAGEEFAELLETEGAGFGVDDRAVRAAGRARRARPPTRAGVRAVRRGRGRAGAGRRRRRPATSSSGWPRSSRAGPTRPPAAIDRVPPRGLRGRQPGGSG